MWLHLSRILCLGSFIQHLKILLVFFSRFIPYIGIQLQSPFKELLVKQKANLHRKAGSGVQQVSCLV